MKAKYKMLKRYINKIGILIFLIGIILLNNVNGANIGISPARLYFEEVLRGGYSEKIVTITVDSEEPIEVSIKPRGDIENWLNFSEEVFNVSKDNPYQLSLSVTPPLDIPNGNYTGFIKFSTSALGRPIEKHATGLIRTTLDLYLEVEITDIEVRKCRVSNFKVQSVEKGDPIIFLMNIENQGNIRMKPRINIDIWDQEQISVVKSIEYSEQEVIPTKKQETMITVPSNDLEIGQYWAEITSFDCGGSQTLTFDVLEIGALKAEGILSDIITETWMDVDETTDIKVLFKNTGEKAVNAMFRGKINRGEDIIDILESERTLVLIDESKDFIFYFTPREPGKYIVSGRVFYDSKRTYEKSSIINVRRKGLVFSSFLMPLIYLVLIILISLLLYKIRKEKKAYSNKLKKIGR
jgi:hypothetical protein